MKKEYTNRIQRFRTESDLVRRKSERVAIARMVLFLAMALSCWYFIREKQPAGLLIPLALVSGFLYLIKVSGRLRQRIRFLELLIEINEQEIKALEGDYTSFETGGEFIDYQHHYSYDLDIFGKHSIFRMVTRAATPLGKEQLASRLCDPGTDPALIRQRQEAVKELTEKLNWRQDFLATAREADWERDKSRNVQSWLDGPDRFSNSRLFALLTRLTPFIFLFLVSSSFAFRLSPFAFLLYLLLPTALILYKTRTINREQQKVERLFELFRKYQGLLQLIEKENFNSDMTRSLKQSLEHDGTRASEIMKKLTDILWGLEVRSNLLIAFILNVVFLWDILLMIRLERWRKRYREDFGRWKGIIAEFETLNSFAGFAANRTDCSYPEILQGTFRMSLESGGHPLINPSKRVDNSLAFNESGQIYLITGANMAGKSTLLRMVGVNMVLAMSGSPVCAKSMSIVPVRISSSVRTNDSLGDDESYFYAELKKLNRIITVLLSDPPLFVIIDEMLKGTNSRDKHAGSAALIRRLISLGASGLVATHDVELGILEAESVGKIVNHCFEVSTENNNLKFDYKLRPGVSQSLNATFLMQQMGIVSSP
ncbi:MAG: hypothetical protein A2X22_09775 [Bacteroidetes bacterium GWF2_49_14]|nr:MAG: hypothetical protein A2X22_09775 [Bacteroidetes bacterium GWF2_49_14]